MMEASLPILPNELILKIFEWCNVRDLHNLAATCSRFADLIYNATTLGNAVPILVTNQMSNRMRMRSKQNRFNVWEKCRISKNWKIGLYKESIELVCKRTIPWLVLDKDYLWITRRRYIYGYKRHKNNVTNFYLRKPSITIKIPVRVDVSKFAYKGGRLVSGQRDGSLMIWESEDQNMFWKDCHDDDINSVDIEGDVIVSGSKNGFIKLWKFTTNETKATPIFNYNMQDLVWSTAISNCGQYLAVGTSGCSQVAPLHVMDLKSEKMLQIYGANFRKGSGVLHIKWESPNELISCGYDANIRIWDKRIGSSCVATWEDPFNNTIYCVETDYNCTMMSGTQLEGQVVLWDKRKRKDYVQIYFMEVCKKRSLKSPIYSLSFDSTHLYTATARNLNILDFSITKGIPKNYYLNLVPSLC